MNATFPTNEAVFRFAGFELLPQRRFLSRGGVSVKIGSRALDLLVVLVENAGSIVEKKEIMARVWSNIIVEETNLRVHIAALRRLLGDDGVANRYIVHVARRGYVFVEPLTFAGHAAARGEPTVTAEAGSQTLQRPRGVTQSWALSVGDVNHGCQ